MKGALKLENPVATGDRAGKADGVHVRLTAGRYEADLLGAAHRAHDLLRQFDAAGVVCKEGLPPGELLEDGLHHLRMRVAGNHGARADQLVDIAATFLVPDARALAACDDDAGVEVAEAAGRKNLVRALQPILLRVYSVQADPSSVCGIQ